MIDKKIHQIYIDFGNGKKLEENELFMRSIETINELMPDYEHKIWKEGDILDLIEREIPTFLEFYNELRYAIQRVDVARYIILYLEGGIVMDLDLIPLKRFDNLLTTNTLFYKDKLKKDNRSIGMDFIGSIKGYKLWMIVLKDLVRNYREKEKMDIYNSWKARFVLQTTGPYFFNRVLKEKNIKITTLDIMCYSSLIQDKFNPEETQSDFYLMNHVSGSWFDAQGMKNQQKWDWREL